MNQDRHTLQFVRELFTTLERLGGSPPPKLTAEAARLADLADKVQALAAPVDVAGPILDALEADRDPFTDRKVQTAALRRSLDVGSNLQVQRELIRRVGAFLAKNADDLLGMFREPFDRAAATITTAVQTIGAVKLEDSDAVLAKGGDAAQQWLDARKADADIRTIRTLYATFGRIVPAVSDNPMHSILQIADVPADRFVADQLSRLKLGAWEAACAGYPLSLAGPSEFEKRVAAVHAEEERLQAEVRNGYRAAVRRVHAFTG